MADSLCRKKIQRACQNKKNIVKTNRLYFPCGNLCRIVFSSDIGKKRSQTFQMVESFFPCVPAVIVIFQKKLEIACQRTEQRGRCLPECFRQYVVAAQSLRTFRLNTRQVGMQQRNGPGMFFRKKCCGVFICLPRESGKEPLPSRRGTGQAGLPERSFHKAASELPVQKVRAKLRVWYA